MVALAKELQPLKVIVLSDSVGLTDEKGQKIPTINLCDESLSSNLSLGVHRRDETRLALARELLEVLESRHRWSSPIPIISPVSSLPTGERELW